MFLVSAFFALYRLLFALLAKSTSPTRRTRPLCQPLADISPNSMGEFAPKGKAHILIAQDFYMFLRYRYKQCKAREGQKFCGINTSIARLAE